MSSWQLVYELVVAISRFIVEFLWGGILWEDGSWNDNFVSSGCLEFLKWGCVGPVGK